MSQTPQQQGTTLQILAPYLPYGIEVSHLLFKERSIILQPGDLHRDAIYFEDMWEWQLTECLPILRPFSALCEPLEDGTVPAVEVAKLVAGTTSAWRIELVGARRVVVQDQSGYQVIIKNMISPRIGWSIEAYSGRSLQSLLDVLAAYDYLRANHFALPVNGRPLVEGVDFIPKSSARPTKEEGGKP